MAIRINTNVPSLGAQRALSNTNKHLNGNLRKLSSGQRITRAGDDAAGLAISETLKAQIRGTRQAKRNASDAISLIQTSEGALSEISNIVIRLRELAVQSASDTLGQTEREFADIEFQQLKEEIDRIAKSSEFNGKTLLNGAQSSDGLSFQIGIDNTTSDRLTVTIAGLLTSGLGSGASSGIDDTNILLRSNAQNALDVIDAAIDDVSSTRSTLGAYQNRLSSTIVNLAILQRT